MGAETGVVLLVVEIALAVDLRHEKIAVSRFDGFEFAEPSSESWSGS